MEVFEELQDLIIELVARHEVDTSLYKEFEYDHVQAISSQISDLVERTESLIDSRLQRDEVSSQDAAVGTVD